MKYFEGTITNKSIIFVGFIVLQYIFILFLFFPNYFKIGDSSLITSLNNNDIIQFDQLINNKSRLYKKRNLSKDAFGNTPLSKAISKRNIYFVEKLLDYGANSNGISNSDWPEIMVAALQVKIYNDKESLDIMKLLIKRGADVNSRSKYGQTALHILSSGLIYDAAKILIENGAHVNVIDDNYSTPLHQAIYSANVNDGNYYKFISMLISAGANPFYGKEEYSIYKKPIEIAIKKNDHELIQILRHGKDTGKPVYYTNTNKLIASESRQIYSILDEYGISTDLKLIDLLYKYRFRLIFVPVIFSILLGIIFKSSFFLKISLVQIIILLIVFFIVIPTIFFIALGHDS